MMKAMTLEQTHQLLNNLQLCQRQFKIDPLIDVIAEVKLTHPRN
ncbi:hypothetical protein QTO01_20130 [Vibrio mytili]